MKMKVSEKVWPIHWHWRKVPPLKVGYNYYICIGYNMAVPCILLEIITPDSIPRILVQLPRGTLTVWANEIGSSQEQAVQNTVNYKS